MYAIIAAFLIYWLLFPVQIWAAISCVDANSVEQYKTVPADPETQAYTPPAGSDQIMIVCFGQRSGGTPRTYTVVYNSIAMTAITTAAYLDPTEGICYYAINPASGSHNLVIDWSAAPLADAWIVVTCSGVDTADPFRAGSVTQSTANANSHNLTVSNVVTGDVSFAFLVTEATAANDFTVTGSNQTVVQQGNAGNEIAAIMTIKDGVNGGNHAFTFPETQQTSRHLFALKPLVPPVTNRFVQPIYSF